VILAACRQRLTPNLSLELARHTPMGAYPLLDYLVVTCDTVEAGVRQLSQYYRLVGNPIALIISDDGRDRGTDIRVVLEGGAPFGVEFSASLMVLHLRDETGGRFSPSCIHFGHTPDDVGAFVRVLGCEVRPRSSWNGLVIPIESWRLPLRRRDAVLRAILESHADAILARLPNRSGLALEVQRALASRVAAGSVNIDTVARQLAMSGRTLQRRLAEEGVSFQQLLDQARKEAAIRYLSEPLLAICEVAYLVGYSEPAPFHGAFKRWYGVTPEMYRQQMKGAPPA
jgi:AraC-like DNA-binding protein